MQMEEYERYLNMMNQWLILLQEGKSLERFIERQGWQRIAVYGMSIYGRHVIRDLKKTECTVVCGIDRKKMCPYEGVEILEPTDRLPRVDAVVNTVLHRHKEIVRDLQKVILCPVVSLEDVVFESY